MDIQSEKVDIQGEKVDIQNTHLGISNIFSLKTNFHIQKLFDKYGFEGIFGRSAVVELLGIKCSSASKFLSNLAQENIIEPVSGYGKGKYRFKKI